MMSQSPVVQVFGASRPFQNKPLSEHVPLSQRYVLMKLARIGRYHATEGEHKPLSRTDHHILDQIAAWTLRLKEHLQARLQLPLDFKKRVLVHPLGWFSKDLDVIQAVMKSSTGERLEWDHHDHVTWLSHHPSDTVVYQRGKGKSVTLESSSHPAVVLAMKQLIATVQKTDNKK